MDFKVRGTAKIVMLDLLFSKSWSLSLETKSKFILWEMILPCHADCRVIVRPQIFPLEDKLPLLFRNFTLF